MVSGQLGHNPKKSDRRKTIFKIHSGDDLVQEEYHDVDQDNSTEAKLPLRPIDTGLNAARTGTQE